MKHIKITFFLILIISISACSQPDQNNAGIGISAAVEQTQASLGTEIPTPNPTITTVPSPIPPTQTPAPIPTIVAPFAAEVTVASLGLRSGPSKFFPLIAYYPEGTTVIVSAQIPNSEWVYVTIADSVDDAWEADNNEIGWMSAVFLDIDEKYTGLPLMFFPDDQILVVYVFDTEGYPIYGVDVAVSFTEGGGSKRNDSYTDSVGVSLTYFPPGYFGQKVAISIAGIRCTSNIMNVDCKMTDYFYGKHYELADLPYSGFVDFTFEPATMHVTGYVINQFGTKVSGVQVRGQRPNDDAYSVTKTDNEGNFSLSIGPGVWDLFTRSYEPLADGDHYSLDTNIFNSETIILTAP